MMSSISFKRLLSRFYSARQSSCPSCDTIQKLVYRWRYYRDSKPMICSVTFAKLDAQAKNGCVGCQVLRRALMSASITTAQARNLLSYTGHLIVLPVARDKEDPQASRIDLDLKISISNAPIQTHIACVRTDQPQCLNLEHKPSSVHSIRQISDWRQRCRDIHTTCGNLAWSSQVNPTYLVHILGHRDEPGPRKLKIVCGASVGRVDFVALSYTWGDKTVLKDAWEDIRKGKTTTENLKKRMQGFSSSDLPMVMQSAISISKALGIDYIWIDNICIGGLLIWDDEAYRMHEVYSNACLTLCACAAESALDDLFAPREAWYFPGQPFHREDRFLVEYDLSLEQVRLQAPMFQRGWTLQEERLSPRIVYWCGQRLYWSCFREQHIELEPSTPLGRLARPERQSRPLERITSPATLYPPQEFLHTCWTDDKEGMHRQWLDMVQDYTRRSMFEPKDRLVAITGLAAIYLDKWSSTGEVSEQAFLAGLWRTTIAQDLAWVVQPPHSLKRSLLDYAPSWSWASLPFNTDITVQRAKPSNRHSAFQLHDGGSARDGPVLKIHEQVKSGCSVKEIQISGRLRLLLTPYSQEVPWSTLYPPTAHESQEPNVSAYLDTDVHSLNETNGRIVVYGVRKQATLGQLDYLPSAQLDPSAPSMHTGPTAALGLSITGIYCLELSDKFMLLLKQVPKLGDVATFQRVGASNSFRGSFFDSCDVERLNLM